MRACIQLSVHVTASARALNKCKVRRHSDIEAVSRVYTAGHGNGLALLLSEPLSGVEGASGSEDIGQGADSCCAEASVLAVLPVDWMRGRLHSWSAIDSAVACTPSCQ